MDYLASPLTSSDRAVYMARYHIACKVAARLMREGRHVFCPVAMTVPIADAGELPTGFDYWREFDLWFVDRCDLLIVLRLHGWEQSVGVQAEIQRALQRGTPVEYLDEE